jgi:hypothetical protein
MNEYWIAEATLPAEAYALKEYITELTQFYVKLIIPSRIISYDLQMMRQHFKEVTVIPSVRSIQNPCEDDKDEVCCFFINPIELSDGINKITFERRPRIH